MKLAINRNQYIELYSIAMAEARHRDRLYTQTWIAVAISATVLIAALGLFWGKYSLPSGWGITVIMIVLCLIFGGFFTYSVFRLSREGNICRNIASKIEKVLLNGREQSESPELEGLLVRQKLNKIPGGWRRVWWALSFRKQGWRWVYPVTILVVWVLFSIFLGICVK